MEGEALLPNSTRAGATTFIRSPAGAKCIANPRCLFKVRSRRAEGTTHGAGAACQWPKTESMLLIGARRFCTRARSFWARTEGGSLLSALAHKVYILPVLLLVAQLEDPPPGLARTRAACSPAVTPRVMEMAPGRPMELPNLKLLGRPMEFPNLEMLVPVIRLRYARDLMGKGCDPELLHSNLQAVLRSSSERDRMIRWLRRSEPAPAASRRAAFWEDVLMILSL
jgi:hypothetical protein